MEAYLMERILTKLDNGNIGEFLIYLLIYIFIWLEVRGMKTELKNLNSTVNNSLKAGELRFENIENKQFGFEHRVTGLESFIQETHNRIVILENNQKKGE